jgi:hypothetical protein
MMDVYLVPTGPERYELYCETADDGAPAPDASRGVIRRMQQKFGEVLAAVEREQDRSPHEAAPDGFLGRQRARTMRWLAERVAEQRLLWRLRGQTRVHALYPDQLDGAGALTLIRRNLQADWDRHVRWLAIDTLGMLLSLLLIPLPGPNLPGYYFTFRVVGHFLAVRGARQGLNAVEWDLQPSAQLTRLSGLEQLTQAERGARVQAIESALGLSRLARFFERTAVGSA